MDLGTIHYGRVYTHLAALLAPVEAALSTKRRADLVRAIHALNNDVVYRQVASGEFCAPVSQCPRGHSLLASLDRVEEQAGEYIDDLRPFLNRLRAFAQSYRNTWDDHGYLIVPVMVEVPAMVGTGEDQEPGLVFLKAVPKLALGRAYDGHLSVEDLTQDPSLLYDAEDYFGTIASVLMKTLYFVHTFPFDSQSELSKYAYRLFFDSRITEGRSIGAATLAMFAICYLHRALGNQCWSAIAPQSATVITGEVDMDGRILPVFDVAAKIQCAVDEFGSSIRVILPHDETLPAALESRIDRGNISYVSDAEELLSAMLSSSDGLRGLNEARRMLYRKLSDHDIEALRRYVVGDVDPDVHIKIRDGHSGWMTPKSHEGGVYVIGKAWQNWIDLKLGLEPSSLQEDGGIGREPELIEVILDGSAEMEEHWRADDNTGICRITAVLFEMASRFDATKQELMCGFLSHRQFYSIRHGEAAAELEARLQKLRNDHRLRYRGPFFRPVYETSREIFWRRLKRVFVVSDSVIPDLQDLSDLKVSAFTRLYLCAGSDGRSAEAKASVVLFRDGKSLDKPAIGRFFHASHGALQEVAVDLGEEPPVEWSPASAGLSRDGNRFVIRWANVQELQAVLRIRMMHQHPRAVRIFGCLTRGHAPVDFSFVQQLVPNPVEPFTESVSGALTAADLQLWRQICHPDYVCEECRERGVHILHESRTKIEHEIVLPGLKHLQNGILLLRENAPEYCFFRTGCYVDGVGFVRIDGRLYYSQARGHLEALHRARGLYMLNANDGAYYLFQL